MTETPAKEPEWEDVEEDDIEDLVAGASDLTAAATLMLRKETFFEAVTAAASLYGMLRVVGDHDRAMALLLRVKPDMARQVADSLDRAAGQVDHVRGVPREECGQ